MKNFKEYLTEVLCEGKATIIDINKLKYFSINSIKNLLKSSEFANKRIGMENNKLGGTQKDTKLFIKKLIQIDKDATEELGVDFTKDQLEDYKYLKSI